MYEKQLIATPTGSLAETDPPRAVADVERALQLIEQHSGYGQWKIVFPGSVVVSPTVADMFGWQPSDSPLPLQDMVKLYQAEDRGKLLSLIASALEERRGFRCRLRIERPDGLTRMIETIADLRVKDGRVVELFGFSRDVTAEMDKELQVQGRLRLVQELVSEMPAPILVLDDKLRVLDCSLFWLKAHRFIERREVVGKVLTKLIPDLPAETRDEYDRALKGQTIKTKRSFTSSSTNQPVQFNALIAPWYASEKKVGGITVVIGWSELAVSRGGAASNAPPAAEESFDGSLLDMLKSVS
jgi:hypothetical protein